MRLIFSRDRAAQLDLLLRSLDANAPIGATIVLWDATEATFAEAYHRASSAHFEAQFWREHDFGTQLQNVLQSPSMGETVTFFCDDDVLYRPVSSLGADVLLADERVLTFSLRLAEKGLGKPRNTWGEVIGKRALWEWAKLPPHDFGYPGSIDGHTFRTADILGLIGDDRIDNPLMLETILAHRCSMLAQERPLMACYPEQALVGVPVNTVADQAGRPHGERFPQPADELNARFLAGERIDLGALNFAGVDGCLHEIPFVWRAA